MSRRSAPARGRLRRALRVALLAPLIAGCHSWRTASVAPQTLIEAQHPRAVRATLNDGRVLTLDWPLMVADTIVGTTRLGSERAPTDQLRTLEVQRSSVTKTLALIVTHFAAVVTAIALIIEVQPHYSGF